MDYMNAPSREFIRETLPHIWERFSEEEISVTWVDFPDARTGYASVALAEYAHCAAETTNYWEVAAALIERLQHLDMNVNASWEDAMALLYRENIVGDEDNARFNECLYTRRYRWVVTDGYEEAIRNGYFDPPVIRIGDMHYQDVISIDEIAEAILRSQEGATTK